MVAPASPMARVATGTPPGIWTMDSRLSRPLRALDWTGTPSTGSSVIEAAMPGRWAAPPAPAMMTLNPAAWAPEAKSNRRLGVRWALTTFASQATPRRSRVSAARFIVGQSERLPMMIATGAVVAISPSSPRPAMRRP